jgi:predicted esterase
VVYRRDIQKMPVKPGRRNQFFPDTLQNLLQHALLHYIKLTNDIPCLTITIEDYAPCIILNHGDVPAIIPKRVYMNILEKKYITIFMGTACLVCGCTAADQKTTVMQKDITPASGEYITVISGEDWGPAAVKLVINAGKPVASGDIKRDSFTVSVHEQDFDWNKMTEITVDAERTVLDAYTSDISGNRIQETSTYIALEIPYGPADSQSNPFFYDVKTEFNNWKKPYDFKIQSRILRKPAVKSAGRICPAAANFFQGISETGVVKISYAWYKPAVTGKRPLIIWLHGAGEGGHDPSVMLLGNKVTALAGDKIQKIFGGAYVLVPQSPLVWMTQGGTPYDLTPVKRSSKYSEAVEDLIHTFVAQHADIDTNRIYIGGCSNGGYMTVNLMLRNPGYFAAAFPVCEAYPDEFISDTDIVQLAKEHMWFTAAANDAVVKPDEYILPTVDRIRKAGAADVHESYFDKVVDTTGKYKKDDGTPYEYQGHWSWVYVLNNQCTDNGITLMEWLASCSK